MVPESVSRIMKKFRWHIIVRNQLYRITHHNYVPRVGDEIRLDRDEFYLVERIVWCCDESDELGERVNVGCKKIKVDPTTYASTKP